jgi:hypothetical protein
MKRLSILFFFLALCSTSWAQFTTVTGTVTDPNGLAYANGTITAALVTSNTPKFTATGQLYIQPSQASGLDLTGSFRVTLADNTTLSPGGTTWNFTVCSAGGSVFPSFGKGPQCFTVTGVTISGASQSISATLSAAAPALTAAFGSNSLGGSGTAGNFAGWTGPTALGNAPMTFSGNSVQIPLGSLDITANKIGTYNFVASGCNAVSQIVGATNGSTFLANIGATTLFTATGISACMYRISCVLTLTATAATSSTLPACVVSWTDSTTSVVETITFTATNSANTLGAIVSGSQLTGLATGLIRVSTTGYATSGSTMTYTANFVVERL